MFGPDICEGNSELKIIFRKLGGVYVTWKKYLTIPNDQKSHFYTLIWKKSGEYSIKIDG